MQKSMIKKAFATVIVILVLFCLLVLFESFVSQDEVKENVMQGVSPEALASYQFNDGVLKIHHWQNTNGSKVFYVHVPELPFVDIRVIFDAGSARDIKGIPTAYLTNQMLQQGSQKKDADDIADQFEQIGAHFDADCDRDMALVHLRTLTQPKQMVAAIKLFTEVMSHPKFAAKVLAREKANLKSVLKEQAQSPDVIAKKAFYEALYPEHPYGYWPLGSESTVDKVTVKALQTFHQTFYTQQNAFVVIVGNVSLGQANGIADTILSALEPGEPAPPLPAFTMPKKSRNKHITFSATQRHILYGVPMLTREDADYFPLIVGNHILGGNSQNNRVFDTIRGQHGLAYSAYSYFLPLKIPGPFIMGSQTRADAGEQTQQLMQTLLQDFISDGPTEEELEAAKANLVGGYALRFDNNRSIAYYLSVLGFYELPLTYYDEYITKVDSLTTARIKEAFKKHFDMNNMTLISVGESS